MFDDGSLIVIALNRRLGKGSELIRRNVPCSADTYIQDLCNCHEVTNMLLR